MPRSTKPDAPTATAHRSSRVGFAALAAILASTLVVSIDAVTPAHAVLPAPVMTGFVPLESDATQQAMEDANSAATTTLDFTVGITSAAAGVLYYDEWEDGFDADVTNPSATTLVWGDGDASNGDASTYCTTCAGDLLAAGSVFVLRNNIDVPRVPSQIRFDGRDRVSGTRGFTITAGGFSTLGSVLSASASAYDTSKWGMDYWVPVGQNLAPAAFETSSLQIMASQPGTIVRVDLNGDGVDETTDTIGVGGVKFVHTGVLSGTHVRTNKPVQVHESAGDAGAAYELRWFTLFPTSLLAADYLNPVGSSVINQATMSYLFNPGSAAITVTPACTGCSGTLTIAPKATASFQSPLSQAVRFTGTGPFVAVGAGGSESGSATQPGGDGTATYDWGFSLVPSQLLTTKAVLGFAPGNSANPPSSQTNDYDDDPVWISALGDTTLYVDRDGDPATGALTSTCDGKYDQAISVLAGQSTRIIDTVDGSMTGARIFTCDDDVKIAGAWGEDPANAPSGAPGFDAGYALIPSTAMVVDKTAGSAEDVNLDGRIGPGDKLAYIVSIADAGALSFHNIQVMDALPAGTTYVPNSSTTSVDGGTPVAFPDDVSGTAYPFDGPGTAVPTINAGTTLAIRYEVLIASPFPAGTSIINMVSVGSDETDGGDQVTTDLKAADLSLTKAVLTAPTYTGDNATFRITVHNSGPDSAGAVTVLDALPSDLTYVSSTGNGTYDSTTHIWTLPTPLASGASSVMDITATLTSLTSTNTAQIASSDAADPDSTPNNSVPSEDDQASATVTASPSADVSLTKVVLSGPDVNGNTTFRLTAANAGPSPATGVVVTDYPPSGAAFVSATPLVNVSTDGTFDGGTNTWALPTLSVGGQAVIDVVYTTPVAPSSNYAQVTAATLHDPDSAPDTGALSAGNPPNQDDEAAAGIAASGDVELTNVITTAPTYVGDTVVYTVTVTNQGPTNTTGVMAIDLLPAGLTFVSATPSAGTYTSSTGLWVIGAMAADATQTLTITARVMATGTFTTTAEVTASTATDVDSTPNNHVTTEDDQASNITALITGATLGDKVWFDIDGDGVLDSGEPGLNGVGITATWFGPDGVLGGGDDFDYSTTTNSSGVWSLTGLPLGTYRVSTTPSSLPNGITVPTYDFDGVGSAGSATVTVAGGETQNAIDFGYRGSGTVGDRIFRDDNGNGHYDLGEGLNGTHVTLVWFGPNGTAGGGDDLTFGVDTASDGFYQFAGLPAGSFSVMVSSVPTGLRNNTDPDGGNNSTAALTLTTGQSDDSLDFGFVGTNSIGDTVFVDVDGDGVQDAGEPGLGGVVVTLLRDADSNGSFETTVAATFTSGAGTYLFDSLPAGTYRADVSTPGGQTPTTATSFTITVASGEAILTADYGFNPPAASAGGRIGDLVWNDLDGDGVRDNGEAGVAGATVTLRSDDNGDGVYDIVASQTTAADGSYSFDNLPPGRYSAVVTVPSGSFATTPTAFAVDLVADTTFLTADFGLTGTAPAPGTIGDRVWNDTDADGVQDPSETGVSGVTVTLRSDPDGDGVFDTVVATTVTDSNGIYSFTAPPGTYRVVVSPAGQTPTTPTSIAVTVAPGAIVDTADFGLTSAAVAPGSIGDRIWLDTDRDGVQDAGEAGVNGVTVTLRQDVDGDGTFELIVSTAVTSGDGNYTFASVLPGSYSIGVMPPVGLAATVPPIHVQLATGQVVLDADIGLATASALPFDLGIDKSLSGSIVSGGVATWLIVVTNNSVTPSPASMVVVDTLPDGLTFVSAGGTGWTCGASGQVVTCTGGGSLTKGQHADITLMTNVTAPIGTTIRNSAGVASAGIEISTANNVDDAGGVASIAPLPPVEPTPITDPVTTTPTTVAAPLPTTGANASGPLGLGVLFLLTGIGVVTIARRRKPL